MQLIKRPTCEVAFSSWLNRSKLKSDLFELAFDVRFLTILDHPMSDFCPTRNFYGGQQRLGPSSTLAASRGGIQR